MSARRTAAVASVVALAVATLSIPSAAAAPTRLRITAPPGESLLVHGEYPAVESSCVSPEQPVLHARYRGTIEVVRRDDGSLSLIGELAFEDYVKGIAEVPRNWPMEALKAQVVAARTYALNRLQNADTGGDYDLCATTECQVYVGMKVEAGPWGERWIRSVDQTAGQVLQYGGEPAITYYSSTSPGRTFDVEDVFGGEALPYLRGHEEPDDTASPLSRWRVEIPFDDLARFLEAEGAWSGGAIRSVRAADGSIRVAGDQGGLSLSKDSLRDALNDTAACLAPDRYPTLESDGYQLPQTVPSIWYRAEQDGGTLVLTGRGWGHGIGMVQWGAYGKAERGLGYGDILAAYYGGLRPQPTQLPGRIRILIAEGLRSITVAPSAEAKTNPTLSAAPPWAITGNGTLRVRHASPPAPVLEITRPRIPRRIIAGQPLSLRLTASDDVDVAVELAGPGEAVTAGPRPAEEGTARLRLPLPDVPEGSYEIRLIATDGVDTVSTGGLALRVDTSGSPTPSPSPPGATSAAEAARTAEDSDEASPVALVAAGAVVLTAMVLLVLTARRRRGLHRP
jgi:SpoIID/LytB domain protein